jgi:hypothetical protein
MTLSTISLVVALAPAPATEPPAAEPLDVSDAEVVQGDRSAHLLMYDAEGEVSAEVIVWVDEQDRHRFDVAFPDGVYLSATTDGEEVVIDSPDAADVAARVEAIDRFLATEQPQAKGSKVWCAGSLLLTAGACAASSLLGCMGGAVVSACVCVEAFTDSECWP